ncbi:MAG: hypothetical protein WB679_02130 [Terracidiphilus sp.]
MAAATSSPAASSQLDVVFDGTWVLVPSMDSTGVIIGVDVYSPECGHPHGAYFANQINPNPWPLPAVFYMLDNHSHVVAIQRASGSKAGMTVAGIDQTINHCVTKSRTIDGSWDLMISIPCAPDAWASSDTVTPMATDSLGNTVPCFVGKDAPTGKVSSLQTLSFNNVQEVQLCGAPATVQGLLPSPWSGSGTLIFEGEVPYLPTLQHERGAVFALANLAGLDLALNYSLPPKTPVQLAASGPLRPMLHTGPNCTSSLIVLP